jgi:hypothetical protein
MLEDYMIEGPVIVLVSALIMIGWIVYVIVDGSRRRQQLKVLTEFHSKLLDRIGTAREFGEFFNSEAGSHFLESLSRQEAVAPQTRILRSTQSGMVLLALGVGLFVLSSSRSFSLDAMDSMVVIATVSTALGLGLLVSTAMSYMLSKRMGLIERTRAGRDQDVSRSA